MLIRKIRSVVARVKKKQKDPYELAYEQFRDFTMIPRQEYINNLVLAQRVSGLPGCVVECGVWRGGMSAGLAAILGNQRNYYLFDSFEGLPPAKAIDGKAAIHWQSNTESQTYHDNCTAPEHFANKAMTLAGVSSFELVKGWFEQTIPQKKLKEPIALLRLDGDWYDSTMVCLENFFDKVSPNGLIILDDYYTWDGCSRALHDFLSRRSAGEKIRNIGDIAYLVKQNPES